MIKKRSMIIALLSTVIALLASPVNAATLLPPGKLCLNDSNGDPLAAGTINFYVPATTTPKSTYKDSASTILNTNPVVLDSAGCAIVYGDGVYRQVVKDSLGNLIWDQLTASTGGQTGVILYGGTSTGSANAQTVVVTGFTATDGQLVSFIAGFSNTGATTINAGTGGIAVRYDSAAGPVALSGNELRAGNVVVALYTSGFFHLVGPPVPIQYLVTSNYQAFTASGTWTKPAFATLDAAAQTHIQCWGAGGGGGANASGGAGGGGAYSEAWVLTSVLGATETVTVATAAAINATGGTTTFGTRLQACGGGAGQNGANGGGGGGGGQAASTGSGGGIGGFSCAGTVGSGTNGGAGGGPVQPGPLVSADAVSAFSGGTGGGSTAFSNAGGGGFYGGGGGGYGGGGNGGASAYGGGGGAAGAGSPGASYFGAGGGAGTGGATGVAGTAPAGGGGRNAAGGRGECRITTVP